MRIVLFLLAFLGMTTVSLTQNFTIQVDTLREYRLHLPENYNSLNSYPLLFAFHGGFGLNWQFEIETSFSELADTAGIIVVYPQAIGTTRSWNTGVCCGWAYNNDINDVAFVDSLVSHLTATYGVDTSRIYATGFSSGAMMAYTVGCKLSNIFAAIAPVASSMLIDNCEPDCIPVPVIHLHAEPDSAAIFHGGYSSNLLVPFYYPSVDSVMTRWSIKNNCNSFVDTTILDNGTRIYRWDHCDNDSYQEIWLADDGGHKWPGTSGTGALSGESATQDFDATEVIWDFLRQFSKDCSFTVAVEDTDHLIQSISVYPNPTNRILNLKIDFEYDRLSISVYNLSGEAVLRLDNKRTIDIHSLPAGTYFLKINIDETECIHKFTKLN